MTTDRIAARRMTRRGALAVLGSVVVTSPAAAMSDYQGKKRPIIVFSPSDSDARLTRQRAIINGSRTGFLDRDVVVIYVVGGTLSHDLGPGPGMSGSAMRSRFRVSEGSFRVILVGKDGAVKIDSPVPIAATDLYAEIDRMPMRRDEIRKRATDKS